MTIGEVLATATRTLAEAGIEHPQITAQILLADLLQKDRTYLLIHDEELLEAARLSQYQTWVQRRTAGLPLQYITGHQEFFGLDFVVTPDVLIPRPETELIIEEALQRIQKSDPLIIDVGTGSGCLAVTLAVQLKRSHIIALDISELALHVAQLNAQRHRVEDRISFSVSDLFSALVRPPSPPRADLIVSNPPYLTAGELHTLQREVREYEPHTALLAGPDGLSFFRRLLRESSAVLQPGGYLMLEMGYGQCSAILDLVDPSHWHIEKIVPDLQNIPRTLVLRLVAQH